MKRLIILLCLLLVPGIVFAEATGTQKISQNIISRGNTIKVFKYWWGATGGAGGVLDVGMETELFNKIQGYYLYRADTIPGSPNNPTNDYDVEIYSFDYTAATSLEMTSAVEIMGFECLNRDSVSAEMAMPKIGGTYYPNLITGGLSFRIYGNDVANATGQLILYFTD